MSDTLMPEHEHLLRELCSLVDDIEIVRDMAKTLKPKIEDIKTKTTVLIDKRNRLYAKLKQHHLSDEASIFYLNALSVIDSQLKKLQYYYSNFN